MTIDNGEAAKAVSKYLELDHVVLGLFDADLFLDDLCNKRTRFCSKFMVNALLSWALVRMGHYKACLAMPQNVIHAAH